MAAPSLTWIRPSDHDHDRAEALDPVAKTVDEAFDFVQPIGPGRVRGVLLHKLMEEFLTGELLDSDPVVVEQRAAQLLEELLGDEALDARPDPKEMARAALNTIRFADVAALRRHLIPEVPIWSSLADGTLLAGRADAVAVEGGNIVAALDWKSDVAPSHQERSDYIGQMRAYLTASGARRGALVYMTLGEIVWVEANT
jgi:PD-(D/E)XK nuclease superfamily